MKNEMIERAMETLDVEFTVQEEGGEKYVHAEVVCEVNGKLIEFETYIDHEYWTQRLEGALSFLLFMSINKYFEKFSSTKNLHVLSMVW